MNKGTTQKLCSNHCCLNEAVVLEPRHLCEPCSKDPKKNGPLFADDKPAVKKPRSV